MARNAEQILRKSVADIDAGFWCQGDLGYCVGTEAPFKTEDSKDHMGCAVGLLSMYGNHSYTTQISGKPITYLSYPSDGVAPKGVRVALEALYFALPKKRQLSKTRFNNARANYIEEFTTYGDGDLTKRQIENQATVSVMQEAVVGYNDDTTTNQAKALKWFTKALNSVERNTFVNEATADALADALA
jgi:hypothetical protein